MRSPGQKTSTLLLFPRYKFLLFPLRLHTGIVFFSLLQPESVCTSIFGAIFNIVVNVALIHILIGTSSVSSLLFLYLHLAEKEFLFPLQDLSRCDSLIFLLLFVSMGVDIFQIAFLCFKQYSQPPLLLLKQLCISQVGLIPQKTYFFGFTVFGRWGGRGTGGKVAGLGL